ncbi:MAG: Pycsar system effector family protein [Pseudomonadota bacterium]
MPEDTQTKRLGADDFDIEALELSEALEGTEGLDVNNASRLRMQFLTSQHASLVSQVQFSDAKAAAIMTVMVLVALNGPLQVSLVQGGDVLAIMFFAVMVLTIVFAMASLIPRYPDKALSKQIQRHERFSWPSLVARGYEPMAHAEFMRTSEASHLIMSISQTNGAMARVLRKKFRNLRIAYTLGILDLLLMLSYVLWLQLP